MDSALYLSRPFLFRTGVWRDHMRRTSWLVSSVYSFFLTCRQVKLLHRMYSNSVCPPALFPDQGNFKHVYKQLDIRYQTGLWYQTGINWASFILALELVQKWLNVGVISRQFIILFYFFALISSVCHYMFSLCNRAWSHNFFFLQLWNIVLF